MPELNCHGHNDVEATVGGEHQWTVWEMINNHVGTNGNFETLSMDNIELLSIEEHILRNQNIGLVITPTRRSFNYPMYPSDARITISENGMIREVKYESSFGTPKQEESAQKLGCFDIKYLRTFLSGIALNLAIQMNTLTVSIANLCNCR
uniref:HNHc domain-containing protein n=1 Tax=Rhabditophanes sp. KR3021 TaxID=114890 RepID=A0AC35TND3_9BILA